MTSDFNYEQYKKDTLKQQEIDRIKFKNKGDSGMVNKVKNLKEDMKMTIKVKAGKLTEKEIAVKAENLLKELFERVDHKELLLTFAPYNSGNYCSYKLGRKCLFSVVGPKTGKFQIEVLGISNQQFLDSELKGVYLNNRYANMPFTGDITDYVKLVEVAMDNLKTKAKAPVVEKVVKVKVVVNKKTTSPKVFKPIPQKSKAQKERVFFQKQISTGKKVSDSLNRAMVAISK